MDLMKLVERIYVAPSSPTWITPVVKDLVSRYSLAVDVVPSDLEKEPI
jgi:hypothetical protein